MYNIYCEDKSGAVFITPSYDDEHHFYNITSPATIEITEDGKVDISASVSPANREKCDKWYRYHHSSMPFEKSFNKSGNN